MYALIIVARLLLSVYSPLRDLHCLRNLQQFSTLPPYRCLLMLLARATARGFLLVF